MCMGKLDGTYLTNLHQKGNSLKFTPLHLCDAVTSLEPFHQVLSLFYDRQKQTGT